MWGGVVGMARILGWVGVFGHEPVGPDGKEVEFVDLDDARTFMGVSSDAEIAPGPRLELAAKTNAGRRA